MWYPASRDNGNSVDMHYRISSSSIVSSPDVVKATRVGEPYVFGTFVVIDN
jgi:hypothetical protein